MDPGMTDERLDLLMSIEPFCSMDPDRFSNRTPLRDILKYDCAWVDFEPNELIIREGDYDNCAFLLLDGSALVSLERLPNEVLGRQEETPKSLWGALSQLWKNPAVAEVQQSNSQSNLPVGNSGSNQIFVQDVPHLIQPGKLNRIRIGEMFGELAALTRTPRTATVIAETKSSLLKIRWQGLRDILKYDTALRNHIDQLYREHSLQNLLSETDLFKGLDEIALRAVAESSIFNSHGNFDWNHQFKKIQDNQDSALKIQHEPIVVNEGDYVNGLVVIRNGFARVSKLHGDGHRTIAYLGKGQTFGLRELAHNWKTGEQQPYRLSLRAVGYLDTILVPTETIEHWVLPKLPKNLMPAPLDTKDSTVPRERRKQNRENDVEIGLLEFLVESRMINGTQAMLIDRDRCTRCDDCVRACATAHDGNPRFVRTGEKHDNWMIAQSCMHCVDPVCMIGCPTGAIGRNEKSGVVHINSQTCIGCATCANSCPYQNIQMVPVRNQDESVAVDENDRLPIIKATKCDLCMDQLGGPACQRACPHDALVRIDLSNIETLNKFFQT